MSLSEFLSRRRSSAYKLGDYVYFEHVAYFDNMGGHTAISVGVVIDLPDDYTIKYGVRPLLSTPEDTFCMINVLPRDMRKLRKDEVKNLVV